MTGDSSAEVSALRSELRSVRSEISDLKHQVGRVSGLNDRLRRVEQTVETVPAALHDLARKEEATRDSIDELRTMYERDRVVSTAYSELEVAEQEWQAKFGRYEEARNLAASIIDVVASGQINRSVVLDVTERLAIQTPRYWVAQATLAVAAWLDDKPEQHREALDYALALDYEKTSLFMALLLRDQDRDEVLQEWLTAYLSQLRPGEPAPAFPGRHRRGDRKSARRRRRPSTGEAGGRLVRRRGRPPGHLRRRGQRMEAAAAQPGRARRGARGLPAARRQREGMEGAGSSA